MKILLVHNYYGSAAPSGENAVFEAERDLLRARGHDVEVFTRHSDEIRSLGVAGIIKGAISTPWNPDSVRRIGKVADWFRPDVIHAHNTFPLISPSIFHAVAGRAAKVLTLHNYRIFCPAAIPMREGRVCTDCIDRRSAVPSLLYGCYRKSRIATFPLALSVEMHRRAGTWEKHIDAFIALSDFQRGKMIDGGVPASKIFVKPNFFPGNPDTVAWSDREDCAVFVGRLSTEKGVEALLHAWRLLGESAPRLVVVGDGPLRGELEGLGRDLPVLFLGQMPPEVAQRYIATAKLLLLPSECFEGFPMVLREAFAFGTPSIVTDIGPLPAIVQHGSNGIVVPVGDPAGIAASVRSLFASEDLMKRLGAGARQSYELVYNEDVNYERLIEIYQHAIENSGLMVG